VCIARVGRVGKVVDGQARVDFFDGRSLDLVDVSMVKAGPGSYVEVFGNLALARLSPSEARSRRKAWAEIRSAAGR